MIDVTMANFETDVIAASQTTPVLVDFWADWCGPCKSLGPLLEKLETAYEGRFTLVKINADTEQQLAGAMPSVPSQNSSLRAELMAHKGYLDAILRVSDTLGGWIQQAKADGDIDASLPPEVVLYTIYARACDPVPAFLKAGGAFTDAQIVELVQATCWNGLKSR